MDGNIPRQLEGKAVNILADEYSEFSDTYSSSTSEYNVDETYADMELILEI